MNAFVVNKTLQNKPTQDNNTMLTGHRGKPSQIADQNNNRCTWVVRNTDFKTNTDITTTNINTTKTN